jgi:hypothetical protein
MDDKKKKEENPPREVHVSGELPDPEEMKLYETNKLEEDPPATDKNKQGDGDDHSAYDYRGNK